MNAKELEDALLKAGWNRDALQIAINARFKCEYCDLDFLSSVNAYDSIDVEHIIPRNPGSDEQPNKTLACHTCNKIKRRWNPALHTRAGADRYELIQTARAYVQKKRDDKDKKIAHMKPLVEQLLRTLSKAQ